MSKIIEHCSHDEVAELWPLNLKARSLGVRITPTSCKNLSFKGNEDGKLFERKHSAKSLISIAGEKIQFHQHRVGVHCQLNRVRKTCLERLSSGNHASNQVSLDSWRCEELHNESCHINHLGSRDNKTAKGEFIWCWKFFP